MWSDRTRDVYFNETKCLDQVQLNEYYKPIALLESRLISRPFCYLIFSEWFFIFENLHPRRRRFDMIEVWTILAFVMRRCQFVQSLTDDLDERWIDSVASSLQNNESTLNFFCFTRRWRRRSTLSSDETASHVFHSEDSNKDIGNPTSQSSEYDSILSQSTTCPSHDLS